MTTKRTLKEIFYKDTIFEVSGTPFIINEIFNTKIDPGGWKWDGDNEITDLKIDDLTYRIKIEHLHYTDSTQKQTPFVNVTFSKWDGFKFSEELVMTTGAASKILGAIMNALIERIKEEKYSVIVFAALDNVDKRMKIYNSLASKVMKRYASQYSMMENLPITGGKMSLLVSKSFNDDDLNNIKMQINK